MSAAVEYLDGGKSEFGVTDIRGIWVASDDSGVVDRIKDLIPNFLPNVEKNNIVWVSGGVKRRSKFSSIPTSTKLQVGALEQK